MHDLETRIRAELMRNVSKATLRDTARYAGVSKSSVDVWAKRARAPRSLTKRGPKPLHPRIRGAIEDSLKHQQLTTANHLILDVSKATGISVSRTTVYKSLRLMGHTNKAATRCKDGQPLRIDHDFLTGGDPYTEDAISFDEAGFNDTMAPRRGWSTKGTRVAKPAPSKGHGNNLSLLLAIDRHGVVASKIVKGGVNGTTVARFFETLPPNRPIILDNYGIHKTDAVRQVCEARNLTLRFTTPYSPWYNPVERAFAQAKRLCEWKRLVSKNFRNDIRTSVRGIKNFPGLFRASRAEWHEDAKSTDTPVHARGGVVTPPPSVYGLKGLWLEHRT